MPSFQDFCSSVDPRNRIVASAETLTFFNTSNDAFAIGIGDVWMVLARFAERNAEIRDFIAGHPEYRGGSSVWMYQEKPFRAVFDRFFDGDAFAVARGLGRSQTRGLMLSLSKYVGWRTRNSQCTPTDPLLLDAQSLGLLDFNEQPASFETMDPSTAQVDVAAAFRDVSTFARNYNEHAGVWLRNSIEVQPAAAGLRVLSAWLSRELSSYSRGPLQVREAQGAGNFPKIPYICILPPGQEVSDGVYVAICFGKEGAGAVVGFAESATNPKGIGTVTRRSTPQLHIDVDGPSQNSRYNNGFNNPVEFFAESLDPDRLLAHVLASLDLCFRFLDGGSRSDVADRVVAQSEVDETEEFGHRHVDTFLSELAATGLASNVSVPVRLLCSLATKPFAILTGNSGTGKTKFAEQLARWLSDGDPSRRATVPVGADWTDSRHVFGFVNYLRSAEAGGSSGSTPVYQSTRILDLLLAARAAPRKPHFLVLDEMNLSHVERYFADFLSALESERAEIFLHREGQHLPRHDTGEPDVPETISLPRNLFVIGTVNVDETTYMFSPKVLDRANVIEFRLEPDAPRAFLESMRTRVSEVAFAQAGWSSAFLNFSYRARGLVSPPSLALLESIDLQDTDTSESLARCKQTIADLFFVMSSRHHEFAYRTMAEVIRYVCVDRALSDPDRGWDWRGSMDAQIHQRILPRLHGSRRKIGAILAALAKYVEAGDRDAAIQVLESETLVDAYSAIGAGVASAPLFPMSHRKLCEMIVALRRDQFVGFIQ